MTSERIDYESIVKYCKRKKNVNLSVGIISNGERETYLFGEKGNELSYYPFQYEIGSCTKVLTASFVAQMIQNQEIHLEDSISKLLVDHKEREEYPSNAYPNIQGLLTHTSGYGNYLGADYVTLLMNRTRSCNPYEKLTREKLKKVAAYSGICTGKCKWNYSNIGYGLLGLIIEKVYHRSYTEIMLEYIRDTLGLSHTNFSKDNNNLLPGYDNMNHIHNNWIWNKGPMAAAGGLYSTADDMLDFMELYFNHNFKYLLNQLEVLETVNAKSGTYIGMGWFQKDHMYYHNGGTGCFESLIAMNVDKKEAVVILSNYRSSQKLYRELNSISRL